MEKKFRLSGLQLFAAEENTTKTTDLEPAISVDFTSRLQSNITELQNLLGITDLDPVTSGSNIKIYKMEQVNTPQQVGEGETIGLTKIQQKLARTIEMTLPKLFREAAEIWRSTRQMRSLFPASRRASRRIFIPSF